MDARNTLELIADFIEARANVYGLDDETQESLLADIAERFKSSIATS